MIPVEIADDVRRFELMLGDTPRRSDCVLPAPPATEPGVVIERYVIGEDGSMRVERGPEKL